MKRSAVDLPEIADWHNLAAAFHTAARGKRGHGDVEAFRAELDRELSNSAGRTDNGNVVAAARCGSSASMTQSHG